MHWSDARGSIRENAHNRIHIKTLPGRRRGHRGRRGGAAGAAQGPQAAAQGVERGKPVEGRWAVGRGGVEGRPSRRGLPVPGELPGQKRRAFLVVFG